MAQWVAFALLSLPIVYVSRSSLRDPRSHGFYRFFVWEAILGQLCLNFGLWFAHPFAWYQMVSWLLLCVSCIPLYFGVRELVTRGKPSDSRVGDASLLAFEKTTVLVTTGVYHYIRHPLYASLWYLTWGVFFKDPSPLGLTLVTVACAGLIATAKADESECIRYFGVQYRDYMKRSKRFVPYVL